MAEGRPLLLVGANVHTLADGADAADPVQSGRRSSAADPAQSGLSSSAPAADAVLVQDGLIAAVGSAAELRARAPLAHVLDLPGSTITPGLTDAHIHLTEWAVARAWVDLGAADSPEQAAEAVADAADVASAGTPARSGSGPGWVRGRGWDPHRWAGRAPHRELLDRVLPGRPVVLQSHDMHSLWVSSAALAAAGITRETMAPEDGRIERDERGEPTGLLLERAGELVIGAIPQLLEDDVVAAVRAAQAVLHGYGITGVHSFPGIALPDPEAHVVLGRLLHAGELRLRCLQHVRYQRLESAIDAGVRSGGGSDWIRTGGIKLFVDGALGSRTAWLRRPYQGDETYGVCILPKAELREWVKRAASAGLASVVHAIGDAAVALALEVLADPAFRRPSLPHRIEHVQCLPPELADVAARAGIVCSMQPAHLMTDWRAADRHWGPERARLAFALGTLAGAGTVLAFGSDAPVEPADPRLGLFAAVQRQDLAGQPEGGWYPEQRIDARRALHGYTTGPAHAAGLAGRAGVLAPGAFADVVAWDRDPLACAPAELLQLRPLAVVVGGEVVLG